MIEWRAVVGYESIYEVSNNGDVRSLDRVDAAGSRRKGKVLSKVTCKQGYVRATLCKNGIVRTEKTATLVLQAFVGPRPVGMHCCHGDGNKSNNNLTNLRWDTPKANVADNVRNGSLRKRELHGKAVYCEGDIERARDLRFLTQASPKTIGRWLSMPWQTAAGIIYNTAWRE